MHMPDFGCADDFGVEPTPFQPEVRCLAGRSHHGAFFYRHRQGIQISVNQKIRSNAKGQVVIGKSVFNELIVQALHCRIGMAVAFQQFMSLYRVFCVMGYQPFGFSFPAEFTETFHRSELAGLFHFLILR